MNKHNLTIQFFRYRLTLVNKEGTHIHFSVLEGEKCINQKYHTLACFATFPLNWVFFGHYKAGKVIFPNSLKNGWNRYGFVILHLGEVFVFLCLE